VCRSDRRGHPGAMCQAPGHSEVSVAASGPRAATEVRGKPHGMARAGSLCATGAKSIWDSNGGSRYFYPNACVQECFGKPSSKPNPEAIKRNPREKTEIDLNFESKWASSPSSGSSRLKRRRAPWWADRTEPR
jgi:hypothetical protein